MILKPANKESTRYALTNWHYTHKRLANINLAFNVYENETFCGVIAFSRGANVKIARPFGLVQGEVIELVRVALNGKQSQTSKALSIALRLVKKYAPLVKIIVSYADENQNHLGTIYQATNWIYTGKTANECGIRLNNKLTHRRTIGRRYKTSNIQWLRKHIDPNAEIIRGKYKHKYIFPVDKQFVKICSDMKKPYPKKELLQCAGSSTAERFNTIKEAGGSNPTPALNDNHA